MSRQGPRAQEMPGMNDDKVKQKYTHLLATPAHSSFSALSDITLRPCRNEWHDYSILMKKIRAHSLPVEKF
jgi:hypothetical protein